MKTYHDIVGDGGSRVLDQVLDLRARIAGRLADVRHVVAVGSGKGGVGKSTATTWLARSIRRSGRSVAILDADLNGPSQARLAGIGDAPLVPGADGLHVPKNAAGIGVLSMGAMIPEARSLEFDSVAQSESHTWRSIREFSLLADLLASTSWGALDVLLVDLPPGADRTFQFAEFLGKDVRFVLVTIPSELARGVVQRSLAALENTPNRVVGVIENMAGYWCADCAEVKALFPRVDPGALGVAVLGSIPFDPALAAACDAGTDLPDDNAAFRAMDATAEAILDALEDDAAGDDP